MMMTTMMRMRMTIIVYQWSHENDDDDTVLYIIDIYRKRDDRRRRRRTSGESKKVGDGKENVSWNESGTIRRFFGIRFFFVCFVAIFGVGRFEKQKKRQTRLWFVSRRVYSFSFIYVCV